MGIQEEATLSKSLPYPKSRSIHGGLKSSESSAIVLP